MEKRRDRKGRVLRTGEYQKSDGKYEFRYIEKEKAKSVYSWKLVDTDKAPAGKRCDKSLRTMEGEIQNALSNALTNESSPTLDMCFEERLSSCRMLRKSTVSSYRCLYDTHIRDYLGNVEIQKIKYADIVKIVQIMQNSGMKWTSIQAVLLTLSPVFEMAIRNEIITTNVASLVRKDLSKNAPSKPHKQSLTVEEQQAFIKYAKAHCKPHWVDIFIVLLGTGMRLGEFRGLTWADCDFEQKLICIERSLNYNQDKVVAQKNYISSPKTEAGKRAIPMFPDVETALLRIKERNKNNPVIEIDGVSGFVLAQKTGYPITHNAFAYQFNKAVDKCNEYEAKQAETQNRKPFVVPHFSPHICRHTFCSRVCKDNRNIKAIQRVMGHSSIQITMDIYADLTTADVTEEIMKSKDVISWGFAADE